MGIAFLLLETRDTFKIPKARTRKKEFRNVINKIVLNQASGARSMGKKANFPAWCSQVCFPGGAGNAWLLVLECYSNLLCTHTFILSNMECKTIANPMP